MTLKVNMNTLNISVIKAKNHIQSQHKFVHISTYFMSNSTYFGQISTYRRIKFNIFSIFNMPNYYIITTTLQNYYISMLSFT